MKFPTVHLTYVSILYVAFWPVQWWSIFEKAKFNQYIISGCRCFVNVSVQAILWTTTASVSFRLEKHGQMFTCLLPV